jgi:drug/metabolite transporter (DMT)-like permease
VVPALLPFIFAELWASSYAAAKIGLLDISPFCFVAVRLSVAASCAMLLILALRWRLPTRAMWLHLAIGGALLHGFGLAMAHAALVEVDATPTALVHAFHPILTAALGSTLLAERFAWWQWTGVALGFTGVVLGVPLTLGTANLGYLALSLLGLTGGTPYLRRYAPTPRPFEATAVQLVGGALISILLMALFETPHVRLTPGLAAAMGWNTLVMSIFGMVLYSGMLVRYGASRASAGFFVVPGTSALIANVLLGEHFALLTLIGLAASTAGVALVWWRPAQR